MPNRRCPNCSESVPAGNFCINCGRALTTPSQLKKRIAVLERAIDEYLTAHHKKMAGSTCQYSIDILVKALQDE